MRRNKLVAQRKMAGWNQSCTDWEMHAYDNIDGLWKLANKTNVLPNNIKLRARINDIFVERVLLYKEVAELTKTRLTRGEMTWAIQRDIKYNKELYKKSEDEFTEDFLRDLRVHSMKYVLELIYSRDGYGDYDTVKKKVYNQDFEYIPENYLQVEELFLKELKEFVKEIHDKKDTLKD